MVSGIKFRTTLFEKNVYDIGEKYFPLNRFSIYLYPCNVLQKLYSLSVKLNNREFEEFYRNYSARWDIYS